MMPLSKVNYVTIKSIELSLLIFTAEASENCMQFIIPPLLSHPHWLSSCGKLFRPKSNVKKLIQIYEKKKKNNKVTKIIASNQPI